jgi:hypothetical protein
MLANHALQFLESLNPGTHESLVLHFIKLKFSPKRLKFTLILEMGFLTIRRTS